MKISSRTWWLIIATGLCCVQCETLSCCKKSQHIVDCTNCHLSTIPLSLVNNRTTDLLLKNNNIISIPDGALASLSSVKKLDLTNNPLQRLSKGTFSGLSSLEELRIGSKTTNKPPSLPVDIPDVVTSIKQLYLYYEYPTELPEGFLGKLKALEVLEIAIVPGAVLGQELQQLQNLKSLIVLYLGRNSSTLFALDMTPELFSAVPWIESLRLVRVLRSVSPNALAHFMRLATLEMLCNDPVSITEVSKAIRNMKGPLLKTLILDGCYGSGTSSLTQEIFDLPNFANITHLSLKRTHLISIDPKFSLKFPKLQYLSIGFNSILRTERISDKQQSEFLFLQLINSIHVESLDISYLHQETPEHLFCDTFFTSSYRIQTFPMPPKQVEPPHKPEFSPVISNNFHKPVIFNYNFSYHIQPSLLYLYVSNIGTIASHLMKWHSVFNENNLLYADLANNNIVDLGLITGFRKLQGLKLWGNLLQHLHVDQLYHLPNLKYLNLRRNDLNKMNITKLLQGGTRLQWLDLGYNKLRQFSPLLVQNMPHLEHLNLRGNPVVTLTLDLRKNTQLKYLDLSWCSLTQLTSGFVEQLDNLQLKVNHPLTVRLSGNRFVCSCETLDMIHWFQRTKVKILERESITCSFRKISTLIVSIKYNDLSKECAQANVPMTVTVLSPVGVCVIMTVVLIIIYQFRWHLRWYVYKLRWMVRRILRYFRGKNESDEPLLKQFHAFVSHNHDEDFTWVKEELMAVVEEQWGFRLCVGQRDFIAGKPIAENIMEAIENSSKTLLVITPAFACSQWCEFEMQMALTKGHDCIVMIYKEEVPVKDMSKTLRGLMKTLNYIEFSQEPAGQGYFWQRLHESLKTKKDMSLE